MAAIDSLLVANEKKYLAKLSFESIKRLRTITGKSSRHKFLETQ